MGARCTMSLFRRNCGNSIADWARRRYRWLESGCIAVRGLSLRRTGHWARACIALSLLTNHHANNKTLRYSSGAVRRRPTLWCRDSSVGAAKGYSQLLRRFPSNGCAVAVPCINRCCPHESLRRAAYSGVRRRATVCSLNSVWQLTGVAIGQTAVGKRQVEVGVGVGCWVMGVRCWALGDGG